MKDGIYIEGDGSFSIDQQRYNFQFGGQVFWEIKNGKKVGLAARCRLSIAHARFLEQPATASGRKSIIVLGGSYFDGKGEPGQVNAVSHGCPPARFRRINVINTGRKI